MKRKLVFAVSMLVAVYAFGQNQIVDEVKVTPPQFAGIQNAVQLQDESGNSLIRNYLKENISYPEKSKLSFNEGTEVVQFTVTAEGNVTDFEIINSVSREIDEQIIWALINTNGMWLPGFNNGKPVDMTKEVSMAFYLTNFTNKPVNEVFLEKATEYFKDGSTFLFEKKNLKKAEKHYSYGINYLPYDNSLLLLRGMCRYELGDTEGARKDWNRMSGESCIDMSQYIAQIENMKGYDEMVDILNK